MNAMPKKAARLLVTTAAYVAACLLILSAAGWGGAKLHEPEPEATIGGHATLVWGAGQEPRLVATSPAPSNIPDDGEVDRAELLWGSGEEPPLVRVGAARQSG